MVHGIDLGLGRSRAHPVGAPARSAPGRRRSRSRTGRAGRRRRRSAVGDRGRQTSRDERAGGHPIARAPGSGAARNGRVSSRPASPASATAASRSRQTRQCLDASRHPEPDRPRERRPGREGAGCRRSRGAVAGPRVRPRADGVRGRLDPSSSAVGPRNRRVRCKPSSRTQRTSRIPVRQSLARERRRRWRPRPRPRRRGAAPRRTVGVPGSRHTGRPSGAGRSCRAGRVDQRRSAVGAGSRRRSVPPGRPRSTTGLDPRAGSAAPRRDRASRRRRPSLSSSVL